MITVSGRPRALVWSWMGFVAVSGLSGCGGGGDGSSAPPSPPESQLTLSLSRTMVSFESSLDYKPQDVTLSATVSGAASGTAYVIITPADPNVATVADVQIAGSGGTARIIPGDRTLLGPGLHATTITVKMCLEDPTCATRQVRGSPQTLSVSYAITGIVATPSELTFDIGNTRTAGDALRSITFKGYPNTLTFTQDIPLAGEWLTAPPPTSVNGTSEVRLIEAQLDHLESGRYQGAIRLVPTGFNPTNPQPVSVPVTLNLARTRVSFVAPSVIQANVPTQVIIRGEAFSRITRTDVTVGTTPVAQVLDSYDTQIRVMLPPLAAGSYPVHVLNQEGVDRTFATLEVRAPTNFATTTLSYPVTGVRAVSEVIYDPARQALLVGVDTPAGGKLLRYQYTGSGWAVPTQIDLPYPHTFAIGASDNTLFTSEASLQGNISERDMQTLVQTRRADVLNVGQPYSMAVANNGRVFFTLDDRSVGNDVHQILTYSERTPGKIFITVNPDALRPLGLEQAYVGMSPDGSVGIMTEHDSSVFRYESAVNGFQYLLQPRLPNGRVQIANDRLAISEGPSNWVSFFDLSQLNITGGLLCHLAFGMNSATLAPLSPHAYVVDFNTNSLRRFNIATVHNTGEPVEITPIAVSASFGAAHTYPRLAFAPNERTVFVATNAGVFVQTIP